MAAIAFRPPPLFGQDQDIRFERISIEQGLSQATVTEILQDHQGFLWVGTQDGLNRYDGYGFVVYQNIPGDRGSLSGNYIGPLFQDRQGTLWVGVGSTLHRYDRETDTFVRYRQDTQGDTEAGGHIIYTIHEDADGQFLIGTSGQGLKRFDRASGSFLTHAEDSSIPDHPELRNIHKILRDRQERLWVGTWADGLFRFDPNRQSIKRFDLRSDPPRAPGPNPIEAMHEDRHGVIWVGTIGSGLLRFDPNPTDPDAAKPWTPFRQDPMDPQSLGDDSVTTILEDDRGYLWIGNADRGLSRLNSQTGRFSHYSHNPAIPTSISGNYVHTIFQDRTGVIWAGVAGGGLNKFHPSGQIFDRYHHQPGLSHSLSSNAVRAILEDHRGTLWIGTRHGGLNALPRDSQGRFEKNFIHYRHDAGNSESLRSDRIRSLFEDRTGNLWIGTGDRGLIRLNANRTQFQHFFYDPEDHSSLGGTHILSIYEDRAGTLWVGTLAGLNRFHEESEMFSRYRHDPERPESISIDGVNAMLEDSSGQFWIGTNGAGLEKMDREKGIFHHFRHNPGDPDSLSNNLVMSLYEDTHGGLWIGTLGGGLNRFDRVAQTFRSYRKKDGLPNDVVYGILGDEQGYLWLSTHKGLARFDPESQVFKNFDVSDGLQSNEFEFGAFAKGRDNRLYFGGINGFNGFFPDQVKNDPHPPEIVLTDLQVNNQPVPIARGGSSPGGNLAEGTVFSLDKAIGETRELTLSYKHRVLTFEFAGLHFADPAKNQYAYMLEGFNEDWIHTPSEHRRATYTNLDPGRYEFRVKASNKDGIWNEAETTLQVVIQPPLWRTFWAIALYVLAGLGFILRFVLAQRRKLASERAVVDRLQRVDRLKDLFLANTSHELRTPLNGIIGLAETLRDGATGRLPEATNSHLEMIASSGKRLTHLVNDILDHSMLETGHLTLQKKAVDLHALSDVVFTLAQPLLGHKPLKLIAHIEPNLPLVHADELRLQQIVLNLVGNAIKFTDVGQVTLSAVLKDDYVDLAVADTGIGIATDQFERIFESFGQAATEAETAYGGVGLGLAVSRQLVRLHGSDLKVSSTVGKGSVFSFPLPVFSGPHELASTSPRKTLAAKVPNKPDLPRAFGPRPLDIHILVVDDEPINRQVLVNHLTMEGYRISEAADGRQALRLVHEQKVDMVLLDIMMPRLSGYEVCRRLRQEHPLPKFPILLLTAKDQMGALAEGFAAGANDFLTKPIAKEELLSRIKIHLELADMHRAVARKVQERTRDLRRKHREALESQNQLAKQTSQLEEQTYRLEEANRLKTGFFTGISHELRTPLSLIIDPVEVMLEDETGRLPKSQKRRLTTVLSNARRLLNLINQLLDVSRMEAGKMDLQVSRQDLVALIRTTLLRFSPWAERKGIDLTFQSASDSLFAWIDADKLEKALDNLLGNAFKFTGDNGKIRVHLERGEQGTLRLGIKDTGEGIAEDQLPFVFDRFFYVREAGSERPASSGIGLSLARDFIRLHGGDIEVTSERGFGSEFTIVLPPGSTAPPTDDPSTGGEASQDRSARSTAIIPDMLDGEIHREDTPGEGSFLEKAKAKILVIEDHSEVRNYLREQLSSIYEVLEAKDGGQGLRTVRKAMPDLIVSDVMMPGMNGLELCQAIKSDQRTNHIPVLLLTAKAGLENKLQGLALGADDYLVKPFSSKELLARIANLVENQRRLRLRFSGELVLQPENITVRSADEAFLQKALKIIEAHFEDVNFGVDTLADEIALSPRQLQRKLTTLTGQGPATFIRSMRLKRAAQLLEQQAGTVAQISHAVGFKNPFYFSTLFRKSFGKTPLEYRAMEPIKAT